MSNLQWTSTVADSNSTRAAIQAEPAKTLCTCVSQLLSPRVDTEADMLLRLPPPQVHPPCLCYVNEKHYNYANVSVESLQDNSTSK